MSKSSQPLQRREAVGRTRSTWTGSRTAPARQNPTGVGLVRGPALLTVREVAEALRVRPVTVYRLVARGEMPAVRVSNAIRVRPEDLEAYIRGGRR